MRIAENSFTDLSLPDVDVMYVAALISLDSAGNKPARGCLSCCF